MAVSKYSYKSSAGHEENSKRALRSCVRCRKNKTKCDSMERRPNPCTSCLKKGVECHLDYVAPPQRSKEMKSLYENIKFASDKISTLCMVYDDFMKKFCLSHMRGTRNGIYCNKYSTRILKVKEHFFSFNLNALDGSLYINNFRIRSEYLKQSFANFREVVSSLIKIYFKWEKIEGATKEKAEAFVTQLTPNYLLQKNQLLFLLCILNFYYDIPGLKYLNIFEYIIESYYVGASENGTEDSEKYFSRSALSKLISGNLQNGKFNSEVFIKHFTIFLFINIVLYGPEYFMGCFMDKYIRTLEFLRKKINFDKNWEVKWINFYIRLLNLVEAVSPSVNEEKYAVDEEEMEFLFSLVSTHREIENGISVTLDCFICLVKFDQYLIERRRWTENKEFSKRFAFICDRLNNDLVDILEVGSCSRDGRTERFSFMQLFFSQLLTLNNMLYANHCGGSVLAFKKERFFNGFNFEIYEVLPEELVGKSDSEEIEGSYYWCQCKYEYLNRLLVCNKDMNVSELIFLFVEVSVGKHCLKIDESCSILKMMSKEFELFYNREDMSLRILKSSCRLIWLLYEFVVFWDMLNHVVVYEPFVWNAQLLLENNGLLAQNGDCRCRHYSDVPVDVSGGMDMVDDQSRIMKEVEEGSGGSEDEEEEEDDDEEEREVHEPSDLVEEKLTLNGGINHILQNVDWVKESADEVFEKIHNVLK